MNNSLIPLIAGVIIFILTGCASPSRQFARAERHELVVGSHEIMVFVLPDRAQAIRTSFAGKKEKQDAIAAMTLAIERASGCQVRPNSVKGDVALITARLKCGR